MSQRLAHELLQAATSITVNKPKTNRQKEAVAELRRIARDDQ